MNTSIRMPIEEIRPGSILAEPVFHPVSRKPLLPAGTGLSHQHMAMLELSGVRALSIVSFGHANSSRPLPPSIVERPTPAVVPRFSESRLENLAKEVMTRNVNTLRAIAQSTDGSRIDFKRVDSCVQSTIREIILNQELMSSFADLRIYDESTYAHSANVMTYALLLGLTLGYGYERLRTLGIGALLHDIGKTLVPDFILQKSGPLTQTEVKVMRSHPERGAKALARHSWAGAEIRSIVLHHHERFNGSGYPQGLSGPDIPEMARIVSLCDVYDSLITGPSYQPGLPPFYAYQAILGSVNLHFEARMVWAFQRFIVPYPKNCVVVLNTGEIAKVIRVNLDDPLRPVVELQPGETLDLAATEGQSVVDLYRTSGPR